MTHTGYPAAWGRTAMTQSHGGARGEIPKAAQGTS